MEKSKQMHRPFGSFELIFSLLIIAGLGVMRLNDGFSGDQAMFTVYAHALDHGSQLYKDLWDVKQPAIFIFYLFGGKLFGFTEVGIHSFELIYWLLFSATTFILLRTYFSSNCYVTLSMLLTAGYYYFIVGSWHMTQVESLVGFPILIATMLQIYSMTSDQKKSLTFLLCFSAGIFWGVVLLFKSAFLVMYLFMSGTLLLRNYVITKAPKSNACIMSLLGIILGSFLPLGITLVFLLSYGLYDEFIYVTLEYPREAVASFGGTERLPILYDAIEWFTLAFIPLEGTISLALIVKGFTKRKNRYAWLYRIFFPTSFQGFITLSMLIWLFSGLIVIMIQSTSWWQYHFMLLFVPLGILAAKSIEITVHFFFDVTSKLQNRNKFLTVVFTAALLICSMILVPIAINSPIKKSIVQLLRYNSQKESKSVYQNIKGDNIDHYDLIYSAVSILPKTESPVRDLFACADPLYYQLSSRLPSISSNGWMPEFFVEKQWLKLESELEQTKPKFLVIDTYCLKLMEQRSVGTVQILEKNYQQLSFRNNAFWFRLNNDHDTIISK